MGTTAPRETPTDRCKENKFHRFLGGLPVPARHRLLNLRVPEHAAILRATVALRREDRAELAAAKRASEEDRISTRRRRGAETQRELERWGQ
jgi:hypothetical protein